MLPKTPATYLTERAGINAVAAAVTQLGLIWRETPTGDVGIVQGGDKAGHRSAGILLSVAV